MAKRDEVYEVEWCTKYAIDSDTGEHDFDADEMTFKDFRTLEKATAFANTLIPCGNGTVQIRRKWKETVVGYPRLSDWVYSQENAIEIDRPYK